MAQEVHQRAVPPWARRESAQSGQELLSQFGLTFLRKLKFLVKKLRFILMDKEAQRLEQTYEVDESMKAELKDIQGHYFKPRNTGSVEGPWSGLQERNGF